MLDQFEQSSTPKPIYSFDSSVGAWTALPDATALPTHVINDYLRFVSYNIWFDSDAKRERAQALFVLIEHLKADFVCLQEGKASFALNSSKLTHYYLVTNSVLEDIKASPFFKSGWFLSDLHYPFRSYGVVILSKLRPISIIEYPLPSTMDRSAYIAQFSINNELVSVATVHLESLDSRVTRRAQLKIINDKLKASKHAFFMGDFNFDATTNYSKTDKRPIENIVLKDIMPDFIDTWHSLKPNKPGLYVKKNSVVCLCVNKAEFFWVWRGQDLWQCYKPMADGGERREEAVWQIDV